MPLSAGRASYAAFLKAHARALAPLEDMIRPDTLRLPMLMQDLAALGESLPAPLETPQTSGQAFCWGALYTLEGSRLGGAMLAPGGGGPAPGLSVGGAWQGRVDRLSTEAGRRR